MLRDPFGWSGAQRLQPSVGSSDAQVGASLAMEGELGVFSAPGDADGLLYDGAAFVYRRVTCSYVLRHRIARPIDAGNAGFSGDVDLRAGIIALGSPR